MYREIKLKIISILFVTVFLLQSQIVMANQSNGLVVTGNGKIIVKPDSVRLGLTIFSEGDTLTTIKKDVDKRTSAVFSLFSKLKISDKKYSAEGIIVQRQRDYKTGKFRPYVVTRNINVTLNNIERYNDLVDGLFSRGINRLHTIKFYADDSNGSLANMALASAIRNATDKAKHMANIAGVTLGMALSIIENPGSNVVMQTFRESSVKSAQFVPSSIDVKASVQMTFKIGE